MRSTKSPPAKELVRQAGEIQNRREFLKYKILSFLDSDHLIILNLFHLPARSPALRGEGRGFEIRISDF
jgi:hypothetical protein